MKRCVLSVLAFCLLLSSCAGEANEKIVDTAAATAPESEPEETADTEPVTQYIPDTLPEDDFEGDTVTFLTTDWRQADEYFYASEENGDLLNDALYRSRLYVEERFNVNLALAELMDVNRMVSLVHKMVAAGDTSADVAYEHDGNSINSALKHDFLDLRSLERLDFSQPWWKGTSEVFTINGVLPVTANCFSLSGAMMTLVLAINKELASANDLTIPYDDVRAGTWTADKMMTMTHGMMRDINGDGKILETDDQFGLVSNQYGVQTLLSNLGGKVLTKDADGFLAFCDDLTSLINAMEKAERMITDAKMDMSDDYGVGAFTEGRALFMYSQVETLYRQLRDSKTSFGILPFPKYDETQAEYSSAGYDLYWGIMQPAIYHVDAVATVMEALSCYNYNHVQPVIWEMVLGSKLSDAPDDAEMFSIVRDSTFVDLSYAFVNVGGGPQALQFILKQTTSANVVSYVEKYKPKSLSAIEKVNNTYPDVNG